MSRSQITAKPGQSSQTALRRGPGSGFRSEIAASCAFCRSALNVLRSVKDGHNCDPVPVDFADFTRREIATYRAIEKEWKEANQ